MMNYIDGVMNYTGSKFKLLEQILPNFDYTKEKFVDLFCGGGSGSKETTEIIVMNY